MESKQTPSDWEPKEFRQYCICVFLREHVCESVPTLQET